jgi:hypothetical protein
MCWDHHSGDIPPRLHDPKCLKKGKKQAIFAENMLRLAWRFFA